MQIAQLSPLFGSVPQEYRCREIFDQRFAAARMAHDYEVEVYERLIQSNQIELVEVRA